MKILSLTAPFVTPKDIELPFADPWGWAHGSEYRPFLQAKKPRRSTRTVFRGLKFRRRFEALSENEKRVLFALAFNPYLLDVRDQYAFYDPDFYYKAREEGRRMLRTSVSTIDIVVTYVTPSDFTPRYHCISIKPDDYVPDVDDLAREAREANDAAERGWTWELLRGGAISARHFANCFVMYRAVKDTDIYELYEEAGQFAELLRRSSRRGTMASVLRRLASRQRISECDCHRLFSVAVAFGFLAVDNSEPLRADKPLCLIGM